MNVIALVVDLNGICLQEYYSSDYMKNHLYPINSCTKSITGLLIGHCLAMGWIDSIHDDFLQYFNREVQSTYSHMSGITIEHLLTMTWGVRWVERKDWHIFKDTYHGRVLDNILSRERIHKAGKHMNYDSSTSYLLSSIVQSVSGLSSLELLRKVYLQPLGIHDPVWLKKDGIYLGSHGISLTFEGFVKLAHFLKDENTSSARWIALSSMTRMQTSQSLGSYGYHWWTNKLHIDKERSVDYSFAIGYGGQGIFIAPSLGLSMVILRKEGPKAKESIRYFETLVKNLIKVELYHKTFRLNAIT